jgi:hypothetical protein
VTGTIEGHPQLHGKQLGLLRDLVPSSGRVMILAQGGSVAPSRFGELDEAQGRSALH